MNRDSELTFVETINAHINKLCLNEPTIIFGQNIISGSRISGLGKGLESHSHSLAINTTNTENSLIGMGFGVLLTGVNAIYLMKQHDFGLLGFDQLRHTNNLVQNLNYLRSLMSFENYERKRKKNAGSDEGKAKWCKELCVRR